MRRVAAVRRAYWGLSPEERFRLAIAAEARGDEAEREAVVSTCLRVRVETVHPAFEAELEGTWALLDVAVPTLSRYLGWLEALEAVHAPIQEAVAVLVGALRPEPGGPAPFVAQHAARAHALGLLNAVSTALDGVCAELDMRSAEVLQVFAPGLARALAEREEDMRAAEPPPGAEELFRSLLTRAWDSSRS